MSWCRLTVFSLVNVCLARLQYVAASFIQSATAAWLKLKKAIIRTQCYLFATAC